MGSGGLDHIVQGKLTECIKLSRSPRRAAVVADESAASSSAGVVVRGFEPIVPKGDHTWRSRRRTWQQFFRDKETAPCPICHRTMSLGRAYATTANTADVDSNDSADDEEVKVMNDNNHVEQTDKKRLDTGWERAHICSALHRGLKEIWNCLLICYNCNRQMSSNNLLLWTWENSKEMFEEQRLVKVVRFIEESNPALQCRGTLADFVYKHYRPPGQDFPHKFYATLTSEPTALENLLKPPRKRKGLPSVALNVSEQPSKSCKQEGDENKENRLV